MEFQKNLLKWFKAHQRPLPWRRRYRPYEVWISEIMLQQTQMETALPYFRRWMRRFPTLKSVAKADPKAVLKTWQGLGYYSRARNLQETAKKIMEIHGGEFPQKFEDILSLKGIGRYTAGAIASIAFNQDRPIVDGNVLRMLSRLYAIKKPIDLEKNKEFFWKLEESLIPKGRARDFNQAVMELGALVCLPQNPCCPDCPVRNSCEASKRNEAERYPIRAKKRKKVMVHAASLVLSKGSRFFIRRRPEGKIMGGLWEFPEWKLSFDRELSARAVEKKLTALALKEFGPSFSKPQTLGKIKRHYTHHHETLWLFRSRFEGNTETPAKTGWPRVWATEAEFRRYPFSSAHAKIVSLLSLKTPPVAKSLKVPDVSA